jgi:hypothetical protein
MILGGWNDDSMDGLTSVELFNWKTGEQCIVQQLGQKYEMMETNFPSFSPIFFAIFTLNLFENVLRR